jgi:hypothetical protein
MSNEEQPQNSGFGLLRELARRHTRIEELPRLTETGQEISCHSLYGR